MSDSLDHNTQPEERQAEDSPVSGIRVADKHVSDTRVFDLETIKKRQNYLLWGIGSCLMGGILVYGWVAMRETTLKHKQEFKNSITTGSSRINPQETWFYQFKSDAELAKKRLDAMENMLTNILKIHNTSKAIGAKAKESRYSSQQNSTPQSQDPVELVETMRKDMKVAHESADSKISSPQISIDGNGSTGTILPPPPAATGQNISGQSDGMGKDIPENMPVGSTSSSPSFRSKTVRKISLSLKNARSNTPLKTVDNTIPAGAFAKAILLGGR